MEKQWVIVADGAGARFMALEMDASAPARGKCHLETIAQLSNPEHTVAGRRDARKIKSGRDSAGHIAPHGYADKRDQHEAEILRRFAARIAEQASTLVGEKASSSLVLIADPRMLGFLRTAFAPLIKSGANLTELAHDYTWCSAPELYKQLVKRQVLPAACV